MIVLIVARDFPKPEDPLRGIFEFDQAKALHRSGHNVIYLSIDLRSIRRKRKLGKYWTKKEGIDILNYSVPLGKLPRRMLVFFGRLFMKRALKEVLKKHGHPDIIHAHFTLSGEIASSVKKKFNIPLVITEHSSHVNKAIMSPSLKKMLLRTYSKADKLIVVSETLKERIKINLNMDSVVIPNIVDTDIFRYLPTKKGDNFKFISVARLDNNKAIDKLITSFSKANFANNVKLEIIGSGILFSQLEKQIQTLKAENQIFLLGSLSRNEIAKSFNQADAFVLASRSETFGVVYIEALLSGLPVIATQCGGPEDFVNTNNGFLVPVDDEERLICALREMKEKRREFNAEEISEVCRRKFSPEIIVEQINEIYDKVGKNYLKEKFR